MFSLHTRLSYVGLTSYLFHLLVTFSLYLSVQLISEVHVWSCGCLCFYWSVFAFSFVIIVEHSEFIRIYTERKYPLIPSLIDWLMDWLTDWLNDCLVAKVKIRNTYQEGVINLTANIWPYAVHFPHDDGSLRKQCTSISSQSCPLKQIRSCGEYVKDKNKKYLKGGIFNVSERACKRQIKSFMAICS